MKVVTLLSDFGLRDGYVAQMKGVILNQSPDAKIVDISHEIERHNIPMGSFILETSVPYFPRDSIHVAVVDPGVGSPRNAVVIECESGHLVGPDNGLMARASEKLGLKSVHRIRENTETKKVSNTFHGRDVFARVAGALAAGQSPEAMGEKISSLEKLNITPAKFAGGKLTCQVLHVDHFGNVITNVGEDQFLRFRAMGDRIRVRSGKGEFRAQVAKSYHELGPEDIGVLMGSQGYVEIALRERSASEELDLKPLDELELGS